MLLKENDFPEDFGEHFGRLCKMLSVVENVGRDVDHFFLLSEAIGEYN